MAPCRYCRHFRYLGERIPGVSADGWCTARRVFTSGDTVDATCLHYWPSVPLLKPRPGAGGEGA